MERWLWIIAVALVALWVIGLIGNIASGLIHVLLVIAVIIVAYNLITRNRRA